MDAQSHEFTKLLDLAREPSSEKRRALLREITDLFVEHEELQQGDALDHVDAILSNTAAQSDQQTRQELADRFADAPVTPPQLAHQLVNDVIDVARPLLEGDNGVPEPELISVARQGALAHLRSLAARKRMSSTVSDAVIDRADVEALVTLTTNDGAEISREGFERLVDIAEDEQKLHGPVVKRSDTPADLLNEMFFFVGSDLRDTILKRTENLTEEQVSAAFEGARARLKRMLDTPPDDLADAERFVASRKLRNALTPKLLIQLLEEREHVKFFACFAAMANLPTLAAQRLCQNPRSTPFATASKAADLHRDLFVSLALLRPTAKRRFDVDPDALAEFYDNLPQDVAQRVIRFWKVRQTLEQGPPPPRGDVPAVVSPQASPSADPLLRD